MRSLARALGAALVIGTLFVPYAQPWLCEAQMTHATMPEHHDMDQEMDAGQAAFTTVDGIGACAPVCVVAHVAPVATPGVVTTVQLFSRAGHPSIAGPESASTDLTAPPPKA